MKHEGKVQGLQSGRRQNQLSRRRGRGLTNSTKVLIVKSDACSQGRNASLMSQSSLNSNLISDVTLGSLPRGLSGIERQQIFQSVPLSPTLNLLNSMPSVCLFNFLTFLAFFIHVSRILLQNSNKYLWGIKGSA